MIFIGFPPPKGMRQTPNYCPKCGKRLIPCRYCNGTGNIIGHDGQLHICRKCKKTGYAPHSCKPTGGGPSAEPSIVVDNGRNMIIGSILIVIAFFCYITNIFSGDYLIIPVIGLLGGFIFLMNIP